MMTYFDAETDKRLLEAETEEEIRAIIASTPEADKLSGKMDLVMAEIERIKGSADEEIAAEELDNVAGGAKRIRVDLSPSQGCIATFNMKDKIAEHYCWSDDFCMATNEYDYHFTRWSNCTSGGRHDWQVCSWEQQDHGTGGTITVSGEKCSKCKLLVDQKNRVRLSFDK
ncbi:MAG: hypothetical protein J6Z43_07065 [Clostridiales bacterium]|nr:hypothetical protein [Clostridiales bacterium]